LNLLRALQSDFGLTLIFIAHDLSVVRHMCDRIAVMYLGKIVELAETEELLANPLHPYTRALLAAVPVPDPSYQRPEPDIKGGISKAINPAPVCRFIERCPWATDVCHANSHPPLEDKGNQHYVACYLVDQGAA
ncbi:MAG: ABC transporter ATP-binding protein, partial [Actinomycetota bacterium]|nr:ABC transporter ATP-binding protein [Actinomycetota bacterium]